MNGIFLEIATTLWENGWQILAGSIIAIPLYYLPVVQWEKTRGFWKEVSVVVLAAIGGMILPLDIYGMIPIAAALLAREFRFSMVLPLLISNLLFNMLVPFTDPGFIWRTGIPRVILAWITGITVGVLFAALKSDAGNLRNGKGIKVLSGESLNIKNIIVNSGWNIIIAAGFLILGATAHSVFHRILWANFIQMLYTSPQTAYLPRWFAGLNVTNPFFLLAITMALTLMNLTRLLALFIILKPRGVLFYIIYNLAWCILLAVPIFFR
jgi:uncharacterized membrane protein YraQ (UPF0718 family)